MLQMKLAVTFFMVVMLCCLLDNTVANADGGDAGRRGQERQRRDAPHELSPDGGKAGSGRVGAAPPAPRG